jgi:glycine cleavage system H protein
VSLPELGTAVTGGQSVAEVESTKSVSEIYAPLAGTVVAVNEALADQPELLNHDPYGAGWIMRLRLDGAAEGLLDAAAYRSLVE